MVAGLRGLGRRDEEVGAVDSAHGDEGRERVPGEAAAVRRALVAHHGRRDLDAHGEGGSDQSTLNYAEQYQNAPESTKST